MVLHDATDAGESAGPLSYLYPHQFMQLTTWRKTGVAVATPVWFAPSESRLYVMTPAGTGKVKRIRNNGSVTVAPSTRRGVMVGEALEARARLLPAHEYARAEAALSYKYGLLYRVITWFQNVRGTHMTYIEIEAS